MLAATSGYSSDHMRLSSDFGQSWTVVAWGSSFSDLAISASGQYMLAASRDSNGQRYSSNYGQTWSSLPHYNYEASPRKCAISASGQYQLFSTNRILHRSSNFGQTWTHITNPIPEIDEVDWATISDIEISASGQYIAFSYIVKDGGYYGDILTAGIKWSSNYGQTWTMKIYAAYQIHNMSMTKDGQCLLFSSTDLEEGYLQSSVWKLYNYGANLQRIYRRFDFDPDWFLATNGDGSLFLRCAPHENISKSTNQSSWTSITSPSVQGQIATNYKGNIIAIANSSGLDESTYGVWISYDSGASWERKSDLTGRLITMNQSN